MDEIIKRLIETRRINEMAYERSDAINRCAELGKQFIKHFKVVYEKGVNDRDFQHHCQEMQSWFNDVSRIVLKSNKKLISNNQLIDWFFTKGSSVEFLFDSEEEIDAYNDFMVLLLADKSKKVVDVMKEILKEG